MIASVYIGFAVADGRWIVLAVESGVASGFLIIAAAAITGTPWLLVVGLAGHGLKDLWQHRTQFVANTRWWPPFCLVIDWVVELEVDAAHGLDPRIRFPKDFPQIQASSVGVIQTQSDVPIACMSCSCISFPLSVRISTRGH